MHVHLQHTSYGLGLGLGCRSVVSRYGFYHIFLHNALLLIYLSGRFDTWLLCADFGGFVAREVEGLANSQRIG
jgi:hypothetical protein